MLKLTAAQAKQLENLADGRLRSVQSTLANPNADTEALRDDLRVLAHEMLNVQNVPKLYKVLSMMMEVALRCERQRRTDSAQSVYDEVLSYVPPHAPREAQRIRGLCLQRLGNLTGGSAGRGMLQDSLNLLGDPDERGNSYLYLGLLHEGQDASAVRAFEEAFRAFQSAGDEAKAVRAIVHWAGVAHGIEQDDRIERRLTTTLKMLQKQAIEGCGQPMYEAMASLELGRAQERLGNPHDAWSSYDQALALARRHHPKIIEACREGFDRLAAKRYWAA